MKILFTSKSFNSGTNDVVSRNDVNRINVFEHRAFRIFAAGKKVTINEQIVEIMIHSSIENFEPGTSAE